MTKKKIMTKEDKENTKRKPPACTNKLMPQYVRRQCSNTNQLNSTSSSDNKNQL